MAVNDVYQLVFSMLYNARPCLNVWHYRQTASGTTTNARGACVGFDNSIIPTQVIVMSTIIELVSIEAFNVSDMSDFASTTPSTSTGSITGDTLPPQDAFTFSLLRPSRAVRNGSKRVPGVPESFQTDGVANTGSVTTALNNLAAAFGAVIDSADGSLYEPVIYHTRENGLPVTPVVYPITGARYDKIGTQNTRKFGRS